MNTPHSDTPLTARSSKFRRAWHAAAAALILLGVAGCSTPSRVSTGTLHGRSFSFVRTSSQALPGFADKREDIHSLIQEAIAKDLGEHGLSQVATGGDLLVGYLLIVGNNASTTAVDDYFGHIDDGIALQDRAHAAYTGGKTPYHFEAGTLVIDIRNPQTYALLKRGYATRPILKNVPDDVRYGKIQEVVGEILRDVKVAP